MLDKIGKLVRSRTVEKLEEVLVVLNREVVPILKEVVDSINGAVGEETVIPAAFPVFAPALSSTTYADVDTLASWGFGFRWLDEDFPDEQNGRDRQVYVRIIGAIDGASSSVSFRLWDSTVSVAVDGAEFTVDVAGTVVDQLLGPLELIDEHVYRVQSRRNDGTGDGIVVAVQLVVRYE